MELNLSKPSWHVFRVLKTRVTQPHQINIACVCGCGLSLFFDLKRTEKGQDNLTLGGDVFAHCKQFSS